MEARPYGLAKSIERVLIELKGVRLRERDAMSGCQWQHFVVVSGFVDAPTFHSEVKAPVVVEVSVGS